MLLYDHKSTFLDTYIYIEEQKSKKKHWQNAFISNRRHLQDGYHYQ